MAGELSQTSADDAGGDEEDGGEVELAARVATLEQRVDDIEQRLDAFSAWQDATRERLWELEDTDDQVRADLEALRAALAAVEATAEQAMTVASRGHSPDGKSQTAAAKEVSRDELVRRAAHGATGPDRKMTISEVADLVDREYGERPAWATVDRAWTALIDEWGQFEPSTKHGNKALRLRAGDVTTALVRAVEASLDRSDLAKQFDGVETTGGEEQ